MASKRKSKEFIDDSDEDLLEDDEPKKKTKKAPPAKRGKDKKGSDGDDDTDFFQLSAKRRVTVSEFRGRLQVDIREYYEADGEMKPGRKGICLTKEQWETLKSLIPEIDAELSSRG